MTSQVDECAHEIIRDLTKRKTMKKVRNWVSKYDTSLRDVNFKFSYSQSNSIVYLNKTDWSKTTVYNTYVSRIEKRDDRYIKQIASCFDEAYCRCSNLLILCECMSVVDLALSYAFSSYDKPEKKVVFWNGAQVNSTSLNFDDSFEHHESNDKNAPCMIWDLSNIKSNEVRAYIKREDDYVDCKCVPVDDLECYCEVEPLDFVYPFGCWGQLVHNESIFTRYS